MDYVSQNTMIFFIFSGDGISPNCTHSSMDYVQQSTLKNVNSSHLGDFDRLPYMEDGAPICGGNFTHIVDNSTDKIEYEVIFSPIFLIFTKNKISFLDFAHFWTKKFLISFFILVKIRNLGLKCIN